MNISTAWGRVIELLLNKKTDYALSGVCDCLYRLVNEGEIDDCTYDTMREQLFSVRPKVTSGPYYWSLDEAGDKKRIAACKFLQEKAERAENKFGPGKLYPDCYLHVRECRSGREWIEPIKGNALLDLERRVKAWIRKEFAGAAFTVRLAGKIMPRLEGDYYAQILTDGRPPTSVVVWTSGGFYLDTTEP